VEGWRVPRVLQAYDLSDPEKPRHIRDFALDGMQPGGKGDFSDAVGLHQPVVFGNRIFLGYGSGTNGVIQILDRDRFLKGDPAAEDPFAPTAANLLYPQIGRLDMPTFWGAHTVKPIYGMEIADYKDNRDHVVRDFLVVPSESGPARCVEAKKHLAEGYAPEPVGRELEPEKTLVFVPAERAQAIPGAREVEVRLSAPFLEARAVALVRFPA
jgi:hypothetical protein